MGVPDDANPLNRRLPAEVVTRRRKVEKEEREETPLAVDRSQVLAMKPEQRCKWLIKALQRGQIGRASLNEIYDIIAHTRFPSDASDKVGYRMYSTVRTNLGIFSSKQQRFLSTECRLAQMFGRNGDQVAAEPAASSGNQESFVGQQEHDGERDQHAQTADPEPAPAPPSEQAEISALWEQLTVLSAAQREEAVRSLDDATKERLEDWLEARIHRTRCSVPLSSNGPSSLVDSNVAESAATNANTHRGGGTASAASSNRSHSPTPAVSCSPGRGVASASKHSGSEGGGGVVEAEREKRKDTSSATEGKVKKKDMRGRHRRSRGEGSGRRRAKDRRGRAISSSESTMRRTSSDSSDSAGRSRSRRRRRRPSRSRGRGRSRRTGYGANR